MLQTISNSFHIYKKKCEYFTNTINCNDPYVLITNKAIFRDSSLMANALKININWTETWFDFFTYATKNEKKPQQL